MKATALALAHQTAQPEPDAAILADYEIWREATNALRDLPLSSGEEEHQRYYRAILEAEANVMRHRPTTARGLAVQHVVFTAWGDFEATQSATFDYQAHVYALADVEPDEWTKAGARRGDDGERV